MLYFTKQIRTRGFTVLLAALVASLVLALGISVFSIAQKQLVLSSIGRSSQFAFYAADTGAECALYWDIKHEAFSTSSAQSQITCGGETIQVAYDISGGAPYYESAYYTQAAYVISGSQTFTANGTFSVPDHNSITVQCWGGGGGGGSHGTEGNPGQSGGSTTFASITAGGGQGGGPGGSGGGNGGAGGAASGGGTNTPGNAGGARSGSTAGIGATAPSGGGSGGAAPANLAAGNAGNAPGGGGSGGDNGTYPAGGGGSGGYVEKVFVYGELAVGADIPVTIGAGGAGGEGSQAGGAGARGECRMSWN